MQTWSVDEIMAFDPGPDYPRQKVESLWAGRERLSVEDIAQLKIPQSHRIWAIMTIGPHIKPACERIIESAMCKVIAENEPPIPWVSWANDWITGNDRSDKAINKVRLLPPHELWNTERLLLSAASAYLHSFYLEACTEVSGVVSFADQLRIIVDTAKELDWRAEQS